MRSVLITALFAVSMWSVLPTSSSQCPFQCTCGPNRIKGRIQSTRAECNAIPSELPLTIMTLKVYDTQVPNITQAILSGVASQLIDIKLESLQIEYIEDGAFQNAKNLRVLRLSKNKLKVITADTFASCTTIIKLYLQENELVFIDDNAFTNLEYLKELYVQRNQLTHPPLYLPPNLVMLDLSLNQIGPDVTSISNLTHLQQLDLCNNPMRHISLDMLASLSSLEHLCLGGDGVGLPQSAAGHLSKLKELTLTTMTAAQLDETTMQELAQLNTIKILQISNYNIPSFKFLDKLTNTRRIQLTNITISSEAGRDFVESLPKLVFLANIQLDESPQLASVFIENAYKFEIRYLNTLSLRHNYLTSLHPHNIPSEDLPYLDISDNPFNCNCSLKWLQGTQHDLQNKQNTLCATPDTESGTMVTTFIHELNCTTEDLIPDDDQDTHSSSHQGDESAEDTTTHIIIGCVIAVLVIAIIVFAVIYVIHRKRRCVKITPDTELHDQQQQARTVQQAHSNDHLLKK